MPLVNKTPLGRTESELDELYKDTRRNLKKKFVVNNDKNCNPTLYCCKCNNTAKHVFLEEKRQGHVRYEVFMCETCQNQRVYACSDSKR